MTVTDERTTPSPLRDAREASSAALEAAARTARIRRWARRIVTFAILAALGTVIALALRPQPVPVDVALVDRGPIEVTVEEPGRTRVIDRYVVSAPMTGNLARLEIHDSDPVTEGEVVARIVPLAPPLLDARTRSEAGARLGEARARREQARASLAHARELATFNDREAARQRGLATAGTTTIRDAERAEMEARTSRSEVTSMEFALRVAEHEVQLAQATLSRLETSAHGAADTGDAVDVVSPVAGVVLRVVRESAGVVQAGEPILEVGDDAALEIVTNVLTSDAVRIRPGAHVRIDGWGGEPLEGSVRLVEHAAATHVSALGVEEQRADVVIGLDSARELWRALGDGYRVETHVVVERRELTLRVPASAVFRSGQGWAAYVVEGGTVHLRSVEVGLRSRDMVEVVSGLDEGARVVAYPGERVLDGVEVSVRADPG